MTVGTMSSMLIKLGLKQRDVSEMHPQVHDCMDEFKALGLRQKEVYVLHDSYAVIDTDQSGTIEVIELMKYLEVKATAFSERVFNIFDEDGSGEIDFREFVIAMWNYCTLAKNALIMFAFDLYDNDNSGQIDIAEVEIMLREVYGHGFEGSELARKVLAKVRAINSDPSTIMAKCEITAEQFAGFCNTHATLLWPAFRMQELLRSKVGGKSLWKRLSKRRFEISEGTYLNINQLLASHINFECFNQIMETEMAQQGGENASFRIKAADSLEELDVVVVDHTKETTLGGKFRSRLKSLAGALPSRKGSRASSAASFSSEKVKSLSPTSQKPEVFFERERQLSQMSVGSDKSAFGVKVPEEEKIKRALHAIKASGRISERANNKKYKKKAKQLIPSYYLGQMGGSASSNPGSRTHSWNAGTDQQYSLKNKGSNNSLEPSPQKAQMQQQRFLANIHAQMPTVPEQNSPSRPLKGVNRYRRSLEADLSHPEIVAVAAKKGSTAARVMEKCESDVEEGPSTISNYDMLPQKDDLYLKHNRHGHRRAARRTEDPFSRKNNNFKR